MSEIAVIHETACIGCTKCLAVCPVDAIIGAQQQMHSILTEHCIGCGWCLPPCPVNCIQMVPTPLAPPPSSDRITRSKQIKQRVLARKQRLAQQQKAKEQADQQALSGNIKEMIAASIARSQNRSNWDLKWPPTQDLRDHKWRDHKWPPTHEDLKDHKRPPTHEDLKNLEWTATDE